MISNIFIKNLDDKQALKNLSEFYNQLPLYISWRDLDSNIILANNKEAKAMGFNSYKDILYNPISYQSISVYDECLIEQFRESDKKVATRKTSSRYFNRMLLPGEKWYMSLGTKTPVFNESGKLMAIAAYKMDLTHSSLTIMNFQKMLEELVPDSKQSFLQFHYCIELDKKGVQLSKRQSECLFYLLRGKSAPDIAKLLGISKRTVETHFDYVLSKMNCNSRSELIEKAVKMGLINYVPKHMLEV